MKRNIYFAGPSSHWSSIRTWIEGAKTLGHHITFDWTAMVEQHGRGNTETTPKEVLVQAAILDTEGVRNANLFILFGDEGIYGAMVELGIALATGAEIWIVEKPPRYSIFFDHPMVEQITYEELRERLSS